MSHPKIAISQTLLNERIENAALHGTNISDLFLLVPAPKKDAEGEIEIETKYGKLKTFFCYSLSEFQRYGREFPTALLLSHKKYPYPKLSKPSSRPYKDIGDSKSHIN